MHENILQGDGEIFEVRNTDCWWVKGYRHCLTSLETYTNVLIDYEEAPLSQEEKCTECNKITNIRKEELGRIKFTALSETLARVYQCNLYFFYFP